MKELILLGSSHAHERTDRQLEGQSLQQPKSHHLVGTTPLSVVIRVLHLHCDKSLGNFRAKPRSAAGTKWYITEIF